MPSLLDAEGTIAIVLGASDWSKAGLGKARSFHRSAAFFNQYLLRNRPNGLGLGPDLVLNLFDDIASPSVQLARIRDFVREIVIDRRDTETPISDLLIYYIGHGTCDDGHTLHLLVRDTGQGIETQSSISAPDLAKVLKVAAPQQRRICIFDCCFSEGAVEAFGAMGSLDETVTKVGANNMVEDSPNPKRGTLLLCSSPRGSSSIGLPNAERTLFTGALLEFLSHGTNTSRPMLTFSEVKEHVYEIMLQRHNGTAVPRPALHQPHQEDGDLTQLPAFPNPMARGREGLGDRNEKPSQDREGFGEAHETSAQEQNERAFAATATQADEQQPSAQGDEGASKGTQGGTNEIFEPPRGKQLVYIASVIGALGVVIIGGFALNDRQSSTQPDVRKEPLKADATPVSPQVTARFGKSACGSISDTSTHLEWFVGEDKTVTWDEARNWIANLDACGGGWKMPEIKQLSTLFDPHAVAGTGFFTAGKHYPAHIDPIFSGIGGGSWVWSSGQSGDYANSFNFNQNLAVTYKKNNSTFTTRAFAVRSIGKVE
jgi:Protein of unknown function (DUF1566)/Caspase domain